MIGFKQYLKESTHVDAAKTIAKLAPKFCKLWGEHKWAAVMIRSIPKLDANASGTRVDVGGPQLKTTTGPIHVRKDREPLDTDDMTHQIVDGYMNAQFGIRGRSQCAFAYSWYAVSRNKDLAFAYGSPAVIIPVGTYQLLWSDTVKDLHTKLSTASDLGYPKERIEKILDKAKYMTGQYAGSTKGEIMVHTDSYIPIFDYTGYGITSDQFQDAFTALMKKVEEYL